MDRELLSRTPVRIAVLALVASALLMVFTLAHALRGSQTADAAPAPFDASGALLAPESRPMADISIAVVNDLFAADRVEPDERYRMPGDEKAVEQAVVMETPPVVLGTAIMGEGRSFATCQLGDGLAEIVRAGDRLGEFTVKTIERGRVVFVNASGKRFEITALKTGS